MTPNPRCRSIRLTRRDIAAAARSPRHAVRLRDGLPDETPCAPGIDPRAEDFRANAQLMRGLVADLRAKTAAVARGGSEEARAEAPRARQAAAARARRRAARSGRAVPRAVAARRLRHVRRRGAGGAHHHRHRPRLRARVRDRRQRRDGEGRHLLPDDGEEAPARAGDRAREPPAVHLPRRFRRRVPAAAGRRVPRPRALRPHLLQPGQRCRRRASRRSPW